MCAFVCVCVCVCLSECLLFFRKDLANPFVSWPDECVSVTSAFAIALVSPSLTLCDRVWCFLVSRVECGWVVVVCVVVGPGLAAPGGSSRSQRPHCGDGCCNDRPGGAEACTCDSGEWRTHCGDRCPVGGWWAGERETAVPCHAPAPAGASSTAVCNSLPGRRSRPGRRHAHSPRRLPTCPPRPRTTAHARGSACPPPVHVRPPPPPPPLSILVARTPRCRAVPAQNHGTKDLNAEILVFLRRGLHCGQSILFPERRGGLRAQQSLGTCRLGAQVWVFISLLTGGFYV